MAKEIIKLGVFDRACDLFEGQYKVPDGISYNSYLIKDSKCAVMDSVDARYSTEWLENIDKALCGASPDYLIIQHMEPDHSGSIGHFLLKYPSATVIASAKAFNMLAAFHPSYAECARIVVKDGDTICLGKHTLRFFTAPMVHWPEVIVTLDESEGVLYSADAFGRFGETCESDEWAREARRYYIGIVGKYGAQVQALLKKLSSYKIEAIAPLHGPVLTENLGYYLDLYSTWSSYKYEDAGTVIAYASIYGGTARAAEELADILKDKTGTRPKVYDLARCDKHEAIADAFRYKTLVIAASSYNADVFPPMREFLLGLIDRGYKRRRVGIIENGSWAPTAAKAMRELLASASELEYLENTVKIQSVLNDGSRLALSALADEITNNG